MSDAPKNFLNFLDQLLPFLAACPPWLRLWVHVLILLIFLTIAALAIVYLSSKEKATEEGSLANFSIVSPAANQQIPLDDSGAWMITGILPKDPAADFDLQVLKLPERQPIPQNGQKTRSTFDGQWSFESAKFAGYGSYEIKATGSLNGQTLVRSVTVICYDKATAYKLSIEREKKFRAADIVPLPSDPATRDQVKQQLDELQNKFIADYATSGTTAPADLQNALAVVNQGLDLLDSILPLWPNDYDLQLFRAYFLKNYFQVAQDLKRPEAQQALDESRQMFEAVVEQQPQDTNAWNGLGSVFLGSGQPDKALFFIQRALKVSPDNTFAQYDLGVANRMIEQQRQAAAGK
jgi:tetratricopeptide (TPR) repeat protein